MNIVAGVRSEYREEERTVPSVVTVRGADGVAHEQTAAVSARFVVADYKITICHDDTCPGPKVAGHGLDGDASSHHDHVFMGEHRTQDEIIAEVEETEAREHGKASPTEVALAL